MPGRVAPGIRDRIVSFDRIPGRSLAPNPRNWREHPGPQKDALRAVMEEVGIAGVLLAYHSERNQGKLTLIDGHLRQEDYHNVDWPVVTLDVTDEEADLLLASHDPLAALAESNQNKLDALIDDVREMDVPRALDEMFANLRGKPEKSPSEDDDERQDQPASQFIVLVTCADETAQAELLERLSGEGYNVKALMT